MDFIRKIDSDSLLLASNNDKLEMLDFLSKEALFLKLNFFNSEQSFNKFDKTYAFFLKSHFKIEPNLSDRFKKYFDYIDIDKVYGNQKIEYLKTIKKALLDNDLLSDNNQKYSIIYQVNDAYAPSFIKGKIEKVYLDQTTLEPCHLTICKDQKSQVFYVFEKVVELLEMGVSINSINILNSSDEDDMQLTKLFKDAKIPYNLMKRNGLYDYANVIEFERILLSQGFDQAKDYLDNLPDDEIKRNLIRIFNAFSSGLIKENPDVFIHEIKKIRTSNQRIKEALMISSFDDFIYREHEHYLLMNYYEDSFPKVHLDNDYLSDSEVSLIDYPTSTMYNHMLRNKITCKLNQIVNLYISYPKVIIEDTLPSRISLKRPVIKNEYDYVIKDKTYLKDLAFLDYAKKRHDYLNFNLQSQDLNVLHNSFYQDYQLYIPYFSGIDKTDLERLITENNTLSAYKMETYNLCPFRYYLSYLLKFDSFKGNVFTYIGNVIHKMIEEKTRFGNYDLDKIMTEFIFPPEEIYKFPIFKEILTENIRIIEGVITDFENSTAFKKALVEEKINLPIDDNFKLTGRIDKILIDEVYNYFLVIDYKYGDENYNPSDSEKDYDLQLPLYLMAFNKQNPKLKPAGMLYQKTSLAKETRGTEASYKMKGIVIDLLSVIERIDPTMEKIVGIKLNKDGSLPKNSRSFVSVQKLNDILQETENRIKTVARRVGSGDFTIKPILYDIDQQTKESVSCKYCKYFSICYSKNKLLGGE
jgi:ATP-dependent helicase/DNAse subunit B